MAKIDIERKKTVWPWIVGLIVLLLVIWGLFELLDNDAEPAMVPPAATAPMTDPAVDPAEPAAPMDQPVSVAPMPPPPTDADNTSIPVGAIIIGPSEFLGQPVVGTAEVADVPSDRGFWLEQAGQRIFAVIAQSPNMEDEININAGQQVRLAGIVYDNALASQIAGGLDSETTQIIADQPAFLLVDARNVDIMDR
ncbi:MAG: hypothetical protein KY442_00365 [Proteobacteria bacterium]|nr:hypothetical protein [Pseudomonadota bacterium]